MSSAQTELPPAEVEATAPAPVERAERSRSDRLRAGWKEHWPLLVVLALGGLLRLITSLSYSAFTTPDSWTYLRIAFTGTPVGYAADRPSGYPLLLKVFSLDGHTLAPVTLAQHLAGLAIAALVYFLLRRLEAPRWLATLAAAVLALDSYAVTLSEQSIMSEIVFTVCMTASAYLAVARRGSPSALALSGALIGIAVTMRTMAVFAIPIFLLYSLWSASRWRPRLLALVGVIVPVLAYATAQGAATGYFGLTQGDGWFLYGRVASLIGCSPKSVPPETRFLCATAGPRGAAHGLTTQDQYTFSPNSPARQRFGNMASGSLETSKRVNGWLRDWALAAIVARPGPYLAGVAHDFSNYLHAPWPSLADVPLITGPEEPFFRGFNEMQPEQREYIRRIQKQYLPRYARVVDPPGFLRVYQKWGEVPAWIFAYLGMAALAIIVLAGLIRRPLAHTRESSFLLASTFAILIGAVASSEFQERFVPSLLPLLISGIALVGLDLSRAVGARTVRGK